MKDHHIKLRRIQDDFADFSFIDVQDQFLNSGLLSKEECQEILSEVTELDQNDKLFFILIYKNKDLIRFRDAISEDYSWLSDKLKTENVYNESNDQLIMKYKNAIKKSNIPKTKDRHIHRCRFLWEMQKYLAKLGREQFLCLHGRVGFGKRWLARDACSDFIVVKQMGFKIFWVNVSKCTTPEAILKQLYYLKIMLHAAGDVDEKFTNSGSNNIENEIANIQVHLRNVLESNTYKNCLIILSDVPNIETCKAFDLHCKIFLITKYVSIIDKIPSESKYVVNVSDGFTVEESCSLLSTALNTTPKLLPSQANEIHDLCKGYPIVIANIARSFAESIIEPESFRNKRWNDWVSKLRDHCVEESIPMIDETIKHLPNELQDYYKRLVIFTDNVNIPMSVLEKYWKTLDRTEEIVKKFEKNSLLEINYVDTDIMVCSLHYLYYVHLKKTIDSNERRKMHQNFVDTYDFSNILNNRYEYEFNNFSDDRYIYFNIGFHLKAAGRLDLFPKLYLDFGFLEQKLRITGLPNTLGDFKTYRHEIFGNDAYQEELRTELLDFLPDVEEFLYKSKDTCLLQYALTRSGLLREEAIKQAAKYPNRLWMWDNDHTQRQRQLVKLPKRPTVVKFLDLNASLIALEDSQIILKDLSSEFEAEHTYYKGHSGGIKHILVFRNEYFIALDMNGVIKLWSLKNTPVDRRISSSSYDNHDGLVSLPRQSNQHRLDIPNQSYGKCEQTLSEIQKYVAFCIDERSDDPQLMCATRDGCIYFYNWTGTMFRAENIKLDSKVAGVHSILFIPTHYFLILNESGSISFFNLKTLGRISCTEQWIPYANPICVFLAKRKFCIDEEDVDMSNAPTIICVFESKLIEISITNMMEGVLFTHYRVIYNVPDGNKITSSTMSDDAEYIILGTVRGIIVLERKHNFEVLRSSVSEHIFSIDICSQYNEVYKYVLISSALGGGEAVNLHGLMISNQKSKTIAWRRDSPTSMDSYVSEEELSSYLMGGKLYAVKDMNGTDTSFYAVDSKGKVHFRNSKNQFRKDRPRATKINPSALCCDEYNCYIGCINGHVYKIGTNDTPILQMSQSIEYLAVLKPNVIVAGTSDSFTFFRFADNEDMLEVTLPEYPGKMFSCYNVCNNYICTIESNCYFTIFNDSVKPCYTYHPTSLYRCVCTTYSDNVLIIGTRRSGLFIHRIEMIGDELKILSENVSLSICNQQFFLENNAMSSLCISADKSVLAVGYENGWIDLYNLADLSFLKCDLQQQYQQSKTKQLKCVNQLLSHNSRINDLKFSPWCHPNAPIILVSISAEVVFWNVTIVLNNQMDNLKNRPQRRSYRFSRGDQLRINRAPSNGNGGSNNGNGSDSNNSEQFTSPWQQKTGTSDKPELLACIKFVGNEARQLCVNEEFTKFLTIDNEGNIFFLRLIEDFSHFLKVTPPPIDK